MKFGLFYEHQLPQPWTEDSELRRYQQALDQIRQNAPGRLAAMDRAVSVTDYQHLAQRFQGVWHAAAFEQPAFGRSREAVRIVIVPAGGGEANIG